MKKWEYKDRTYVLAGGFSPLTYKVSSRGILWWDEEKKLNRMLRYATNQKSIFVDEQDDNAILGHIMFEDGVLFTRKHESVLQQLLSIYHPNAESKWEEIDEQKEAEDEVDTIVTQLEALNLVSEIDIEHLEAIMRTELGSSVSDLSSKELKRDAYLFAKKEPVLFLELHGDEDIKLRNLANRAVESGILKLTDENTIFKLATTGKKILTVPFDQQPYAALSQYFKTDDGVALMKSITKKLG